MFRDSTGTFDIRCFTSSPKVLFAEYYQSGLFYWVDYAQLQIIISYDF